MPVTAKLRRRWFGVVCLLMAITLLAAGETTPGKWLNGIWFVIYWLLCLVFAALALLAAILDARALRHEARAQQRELLAHALEGIEATKNQRTNQKAQSHSPPPISDSKRPSQ